MRIAGQARRSLSISSVGKTQERSWAVLKEGGRLVATLNQPSEEKAREHRARGISYLTQSNAGELAQIAGLSDEGKMVAKSSNVLIGFDRFVVRATAFSGEAIRRKR